MDLSLFALIPWLALLSDCGLANGSSYGGLFNNNNLTWVGARQACRNTQTGCDLSVQSTQQLDFWKSVSLTVGTSYWVGARLKERPQWKKSKKPLIEQLGCYEKPQGLKSTVRALRYNGPERCLTQCDGNYVALQDTTCYCVKKDMMGSFTQELSQEECHINCNKEAASCGGTDSVSLYKIPDQTLYEKSGKSTAFFWQRTFTNEAEQILFTNKPGKQKSGFCASPSNDYKIVALGKTCPAGTELMSFEGVNIMQFLEDTSSNSDWYTTSFSLPLVFSGKRLWLNGEEATVASGYGPCVTITYDGQNYSLVSKTCKERLPSVCSCFGHTFTTDASTEQTTITTTVPVTTSPEPETTTSPEPETSPFAPTMTEDSELEETSGRMGMTTMASESTASAGDGLSSNVTDQAAEQETDKDGNLLFPFQDMQENDGPSRGAPPASPGQSSGSDDSPASAAASIEVIVGTAVGIVALVLIIVIVAIVMRRRRRQNSATLLKSKAKPAPGRVTNYPI